MTLGDDIGRWFAWAPAWAISLVEFGLAVGLALLLYALVLRGLKRLVNVESAMWSPLIRRTRGLGLLVLIAIALAVVMPIAPLSVRQVAFVQGALVIAVICIIGWIAWIALHLWIALYLQQFTADAADPYMARKHVTQTHILQRMGGLIIWLTVIGAALMTFESVRQYGISLLASAGAAGIILGLALQPVLKNLLAGIQIAITQPIRIGDSLVVEKENGTVEDIKSTYVVVRLWDLRRLIVPLSYFIEQPFQNWTRNSSNLLGAVMLYVDFAVPIGALRDHARQIVEASKFWNRDVFVVQVTEFREQSVELRILVSAPDAGKLFDLRCEVREGMLAYLQREHAGAFARTRIEASLDNPQLPLPGGAAGHPRASAGA